MEHPWKAETAQIRIVLSKLRGSWPGEMGDDVTYSRVKVILGQVIFSDDFILRTANLHHYLYLRHAFLSNGNIKISFLLKCMYLRNSFTKYSHSWTSNSVPGTNENLQANPSVPVDLRALGKISFYTRSFVFWQQIPKQSFQVKQAENLMSPTHVLRKLLRKVLKSLSLQVWLQSNGTADHLDPHVSSGDRHFGLQQSPRCVPKHIRRTGKCWYMMVVPQDPIVEKTLILD